MLIRPLIIDSTLLKCLKAGDEQTYRKVFDSFFPKITGFCIGFLKDQDKSKSIAQEAFIKLWLNRENIQKPSGISAYLYTAAKTECLNVLRHQQVVRRFNDRSLQQRENNLQIEALEEMDTDEDTMCHFMEELNRAIEKLPKKSRLVFTMSRMENKKIKDISKELGISQKAVEANMTRALKKLRESLSEFKSTIFFIDFFEF